MSRTSEPGPSRWRGRTIAGLVWLTTAFVVAYEIAPSSLLPVVVESLGVGEAAASWLVSGLFLAMAVFAIPAGIVLDRASDRHAFVASTAGVFVLALLAWYAARNGAFGWLVAVRFASGGLIVALWTAGVNAVGAVYAGRRQATGIGFYATAIPAGLALAHLASPTLADAVGWAATLPLFGGLALVAAAAFWLLAAGIDGSGRGTAPTRGEFAAVLRNPAVWTVAGLAFAAFSLNIFFVNWLPSFLVDRLDVTLALGGAFAALFPAIGILGRATSGVVSDRLFQTRRRPVVLASFLVTAPLVGAIVVVRTTVVLLAAVVIAGFVVQVGLALLFTYVRELVATNVVGTALAVLNAVGFLGAFSAPLLSGLLFERTGTHGPVFAYAGVLAVVGIALAWYAPEPNGSRERAHR